MKKTKNKRCLLIRNSWGYGGAENYAANLAIVLKQEGYTPIVVTRVNEIAARCLKNEIDCIKGPWYKKQGWGRIYFFLYPLTTAWYVYILLRYKIDVVHPQSRDDFIFATRAARILRRPVIWTDHADLKYVVAPGASSKLIKLTLENAHYTRGIVAVSHSEKKEILKACPNFPKLIVIHNGVLLNNVPHTTPSTASDRQVILGSTSRLVDSKGIEELIAAYAGVKTGVKTELWLVGSGEDEQKYKSLAKKLKIEHTVKFLGFQDNVWSYLSKMDIFIHPSYHEAFSLSVVEACAAAKAIIATNVGGTPEIINSSCGILIPPKTVEPLSAAMKIMIEDKSLRQKLGESAYQRAINNFDFEKLCRTELFPLYFNRELPAGDSK